MGFTWLDLLFIALGYFGGILTPFIAIVYFLAHAHWVSLVKARHKANSDRLYSDLKVDIYKE